MTDTLCLAALLIAAEPDFRVTAQRVSSRLDLPAGPGQTELQLALIWPATARVYLVDVEPTISVIRDTQGQAYIPPEGSQVQFAPEGSPTLLTARLGSLPRAVERLALVKGRLNVVCAARMLDITFDDLAKAFRQPLERREAGVVVRLEQLTHRGNGTWLAKMRIDYPEPLPEFESFQSWLPENRIALRRKGLAKLYPAAAYEIDRQGRTRAEATYRFRDVPLEGPDQLGEWELLYATPASIQTRQIPFEINDLPLP